MEYLKKYDLNRAEGTLSLNDTSEIISNGEFLLTTEFPGKDRICDPVSLLLAAITGSTLFTVRNYARSKGWMIENLHVELAMLSVNDAKGQWTELFQELHIDASLQQWQVEELLHAAERSPIKSILNSSILMTTLVKLMPERNRENFQLLSRKQIDYEKDNDHGVPARGVDISRSTAG